MKKNILLLITLLLSLSVCAQTEEELNSWAEKGIAAYKQGNHQEAILYFEKYKETYGKHNQKDELYGNILFLLANCYSKIEDFTKAVEYGTKAVEIRKNILGEDHPDYALSLNNLASYYSFLGNHAKAVECGTKAVEIFKTTLGEDHPDYATSLNNLACYYSDLGDYAKAVEYATKAMEIRKATLGEDHPDYATSLNKIALYHSYLADYAKAVEYETKAMEIRKATLGENHPDYTSALNNLATYCSYLGDYAKAMEYGTKALEIRKSTLGENHPDYATSLDNLAGFFSDLGYHAKAAEYATKAMEIRKATLGEDHPLYATSLNNIAFYYSSLGDYAKAVAYATKAMEKRKAILGEDHPDYAISLNNIANLYSNLGDYNKAVEYGTMALRFFKATLGENHPDYATSLNNIASCYYKIGDYAKAVEYGTRAMEIRKTTLGVNHPDYATSLDNLANYYSEIDDYHTAVEYATRAMEIRKTTLGENHPDHATSLNNIADHYYHLGDYNKAAEYATKAVEIRKSTLGENHPDYATSLNNLARYYSDLGNNAIAVEYGTKVMELLKATIGENHNIYASALGNLAYYHHQHGDHYKAMEYNKKCVSIFHANTLRQFANLTTNLRTSLWNSYNYHFTDHYPYSVLLSYQSSDPETIADLYDKSALFAKGLLLTTETEMNKLILESGDEEALRMFEVLQTQRLQLQKLYETPITERHINADSLAQAADLLEKKLVDRSKVYGDFTRKLRTTWKDVQAALDKDEIAVEFLSFNAIESDSTMVAALTLKKGDNAPKFIQLFQQDQLEALKDKQHFIRQEVTDLVWKPMQEELHGIHRIYFSPSGMLHSIGIECLPGMEEYDIHRLSTTREIIDMKERTGKKNAENMTAALYGGIDYEAADTIAQTKKKDGNEEDGISRGITASLHQAFVDNLGLRGSSFNTLPGSLTEVKNIKAYLEEKNRQVEMFTGRDATETSFLALSAHAPGILHIATHGFYYTEKEKKMMDARCMLTQDDDRLGATEKEDKALTRSGLLLAGANKTLKNKNSPMDEDDGILTAKEISKLDLRGLDLVVLSACETGKGDVTQGEGVFGLQRGFKKAGAGTIVMSLWKVDDNATQRMMTHFYENLCNGMEKHKALQMAQKHLQEYKDEKGENIYNQPLFWAGFIILD